MLKGELVSPEPEGGTGKVVKEAEIAFKVKIFSPISPDCCGVASDRLVEDSQGGSQGNKLSSSSQTDS